MAAEPIITREPGSATRLAMDQAFAEAGVVPRIEMEIASNETIKQAAAAGLRAWDSSRRTHCARSSPSVARRDPGRGGLPRDAAVVRGAPARPAPAPDRGGVRALRGRARRARSSGGRTAGIDAGPEATMSGARPRPSTSSSRSRPRSSRWRSSPRAYLLTGSVGLLSDALESGVNLAAALVALATLSYAHSGEDDDHNFGHEKAEYFSSGIEGALIFVAAAAIIWSAIPRLLAPQPLEQVGAGPRAVRARRGREPAVRLVPAQGRARAPLDHARGGRAAPPHRRLDDGGRHRRRGGRALHRLADPRPADRHRGGACRSCGPAGRSSAAPSTGSWTAPSPTTSARAIVAVLEQVKAKGGDYHRAAHARAPARRASSTCTSSCPAR